MLFPRWANTAYAIGLISLAVIAVTAVVAPMVYVRTPYATSQFAPVIQPIEFDHRHHVRDDGIDCLYCHPGAERDASAGLPATAVCIGCHGQIWIESPHLLPVRESWERGTAIAWRRVNDLPDHVYFHHGVHVDFGIECATCHGDVRGMPRVERVADLTMGWCLDCHRAQQRGRQITRLTTCSACHR